MTLKVHGDIAAAVIHILSSASEVLAFSPVKITTDLRGYSEGDVWVTVERLGGTLRTSAKVLDKPRVDINVYGTLRSATHDLMQTIQAVLFRDGPGYRGYGSAISDVSVETGIFRADDKLADNIPRYIVSLRLTALPS